MLHITRRGDYAIRGMVYLAGQPADRMVLLSDMAATVDVPQSLLAKIFQHLNRVGLVNSFRGTGGGFKLGRTTDKISLLEIIEAVEGPIVLNRCLVSKGACKRDDTCPVHPVWQDFQDKIRSMLQDVTLRQLAGQ
ncbi:MAG: HTH-type transcriptional regulator IscR [Syntrophus sp. SKADARSKE-3]|nr:HTH-type transcriptional regulator IscR [Syntrophus sp. SKADARSKE-3]